MKKISILLCVATALAAFSCNKEVQDVQDPQTSQAPEVELVPMTFTATTTETRTVLDEDHVSIKWLSTDKISVWDGHDNREFTSNGEGAKVKFNGEAADAQNYLALYPYDASATFGGISAHTTLAADQEPVDGSFANGLNINAATSADKTTFHFENVMSVAKFTLDATKLGGKTIKSVKFASTYPLAGDVNVRIGNDGISASAGDATVKEVTMTSESGLADGTYYFVVLPNAGGEITMTFETTDGFIARKTATLSKPFTAGYIKNLGTVQGLVWTKVFFYESFDQCDGTGGNDGEWSGSIASSNVVTDNTGWVFTNDGGAKECVRLGTGSKKGKAITPALALTGNVNLAFKAGAWNGGSEKTTLVLSADNATLNSTSVEMSKGVFTDYDLILGGATTNTTITFEGLNASNSRFFLDEVLIYVGDKALAFELVDKEIAPVIEKELNETLSISGNIKKQFNVGDSFSFGEGVVKATYSNGEEKVLTVNDVVVSGFSSSAPADVQTITLTYTEGGSSATATYNVQIVGTVTGAKYKKVTTFTSGKKYLIVAGNGDQYIMPHPGTSGSTLAGVSVSISSGEIESDSVSDACAFTITYEKVDGYWNYVISFTVNGSKNYVAGAGKTSLKSITQNPAAGNDGLWSITQAQSGSGAFVIQNASLSNRYIRYRPLDDQSQAVHRFGNYTNGENTGYYNVDLYEYITE